MTYSLDTNAVIAIFADRQGPVALRLRAAQPRDVALSAVVMHELYWGAYRSRQTVDNLRRLEGLLFPMIDFGNADAREAGQVRAELAVAGTPIGAYDALIAGQARARGLIVVTANTREFARVAGLMVEDWAV